jgi:hydrogenase nickel incorporation protein HypA/HybF
MHELAIAQQLIESAAASLPVMEAPQVVSMHVRLGLLAGLSKEELAFGFSVMSKDTPFDGAQLMIEDEAVSARCLQCNHSFSVTDTADLDVLCCPACASTDVQVVEGKGITILSLEVKDESDRS